MTIQLDLFSSSLPKDPTSFVREWRDGRSFARLVVSQWGDVWCYGIDLLTATAGRFFAPMPKWNRYATFAEAVDAGTDEMMVSLRKEAASLHDSATAFKRLLSLVERTQPEQQERHDQAEVAERVEQMMAQPWRRSV